MFGGRDGYPRTLEKQQSACASRHQHRSRSPQRSGVNIFSGSDEAECLRTYEVDEDDDSEEQAEVEYNEENRMRPTVCFQVTLLKYPYDEPLSLADLLAVSPLAASVSGQNVRDAMRCNASLCYAMLVLICYAMLCYSMLCCAMI